jgi:hypothetical protein
MKKSILAFAVAALIAAPAFAAPAASAKSSEVTLGDFAVRLAVNLGTKPADATAAVETLNARGAKISTADLSARVTEGVAARILGDLGVSVSTTAPGKALTSGKADQLLSTASLSLSAATTSSVDLPTTCLNNMNRGLCVECCKTANGCVDQEAQCDYASACSHFCKAVLPPGQASPSEPQ